MENDREFWSQKGTVGSVLKNSGGKEHRNNAMHYQELCDREGVGNASLPVYFLLYCICATQRFDVSRHAALVN